VESAKFVLAPQIYGLNNLLEAICEIFDNYTLAKEIFEFLDWKIKKDDFKQKHIRFVYYLKGYRPRIDVQPSNDTFGIGKQILHYAIENDQNEIAQLLISSAQDIDVNCWYHVQSRSGRSKSGYKFIRKHLFEKALEKKQIDVIRAIVKHRKLNSMEVFSSLIKNSFLNPNLKKELILSLLNQENLDFAQAFEKCIKSGSFEIFKIFATPKYLTKMIPWVETKAFLFIIKNIKYNTLSWLEHFLENVKNLKINISSQIPLHSAEILKDCSYYNKYSLLTFLVDTLKFKVTQEIIKYAKNNQYDPDYESDSWDYCCPSGGRSSYVPGQASETLIEYLESKIYIPCKAPSPKRQKLH